MRRKLSTVLGVLGGMGLWCGAALAQDGGMKPVLNGAREELVWAPVVACFAEGTDPIYRRRVETMVNQMNALRFGMDYQLGGRWSGSQGSPRALLWSFVGDGVSIPSGIGEPTSPNTLFATLDAQFAAQGGRATWVSRFVAVFARWQALSGLTYTRVTVGGNDWDDNAAWGTGGAAGFRGDVRIAAHPIDGASGPNVLAYNSFPPGGDMVLDSQNTWSSSTNSNRFLRNTVAHEHGHGIGMSHVCPDNGTQLMEPIIFTGYDGPQQDDIRGVQRNYGDPYEANDTSATARPIGALAIPGALTFGTTPAPAVSGAAALSIDADGESDFWSFTVPGPATVSVSATPVGTTYNQAAQTNPCGAGSPMAALSIADLSVAVIASNGSTVLGSSSSAGIGLTETVSNVALPSAGTYFVRITEANAPTQSQLYQFSLVSSAQAVCPSFTTQPVGSTECEGFTATFTAVATGTPAPTYQWRRNLVPIVGANASTYSIGSVTLAQAGTYDCVATNACGSVPSTAVALVVNTPPGITGQPANQAVALGASASFSVTATGSPSPTHQWRKNLNPIAGATATTYSIASVTANDAGSYDCVASNSCDTVTSNAATLTINQCYPNCDGSSGTPLLTANDFTCFVNAFAAGLGYANCDGSSGTPLLTANDFVCFVNLYASGCP